MYETIGVKKNTVPMPRLTNHNYLARHHRLRNLWCHDKHRFARLSPNQQAKLHAYYQPFRVLNDGELLAHRRIITKERPFLPAAASRAYRQLTTSSMTHRRPVNLPRRHPTPHRTISVHPVINPDGDIRALARAIVEHAKQLAVKDNSET